MKKEQTSSRYIISVITAIRNSNPKSIHHYTRGYCFDFHMILRSIFGNNNVEIWYDYIEGHVYTKIGKYWYDIRGIWYKVNKTCIKYIPEGDLPHRWSRRLSGREQ